MSLLDETLLRSEDNVTVAQHIIPMSTQRHFDDKKSSIFGCMVEIWLKLNLDCILSSKSRRKWLVVLQLFFDCILPIECGG